MVNSRFVLMKNRVRPDSQLVNSWGCNSWRKGMGSPGRKTCFRIFRTWKNTPDFTSP